MSHGASRRILRGSVVSWIRIGVMLLVQLFVTPLFLSFWGAARYGDWLVLLTAVGMVQMLALSHQSYIGFEIMRTGLRRPRFYARMVRTGFLGLWFITGCQMLATVIIAAISYRNPSGGLSDMGWALVIMGWMQFPVSNFGAIWERIVAQQGGYERTCWWGIVSAILTSAAPLFVVPFHGGLLAATWTYSGVTLLVTAATTYDLRRVGRLGIRTGARPSWRLLAANLLNSQWLTAKTLMDGVRQSGVRLVINPLGGPAALAAFSTMRTGANVALQGLGTITAPVTPELMRFLSMRDQARSEAALGTVWLFLAVVLSPGVIVLQVIVQPLFVIWTRGKIPFDPPLFASLSLGVLVYAFSQPAVVLVQGNNLVRIQVWITGLAAGVTVGGILLLMPIFHLLGAGLALLAAEVVAAWGYFWVASHWMKEHGLVWPWAAWGRVTASQGIAAVTLGGIAWLPHLALPIAVFGVAGLAFTAVLYWRKLPVLAHERVVGLVMARLPKAWKERYL